MIGLLYVYYIFNWIFNILALNSDLYYIKENPIEHIIFSTIFFFLLLLTSKYKKINFVISVLIIILILNFDILVHLGRVYR